MLVFNSLPVVAKEKLVAPIRIARTKKIRIIMLRIVNINKARQIDFKQIFQTAPITKSSRLTN